MNSMDTLANENAEMSLERNFICNYDIDQIFSGNVIFSPSLKARCNERIQACI